MIALRHPPPAPPHLYAGVRIAGWLDGTFFPLLNSVYADVQQRFWVKWRHMCVSFLAARNSSSLSVAKLRATGPCRESQCRSAVGNALLFLANGVIAWANSNNWGTRHDSRQAIPLYALLEDPTKFPAHLSIAADTAFRDTGHMEGKIYTPEKPKRRYSYGVGQLHQLLWFLGVRSLCGSIIHAHIGTLPHSPVPCAGVHCASSHSSRVGHSCEHVPV